MLAGKIEQSLAENVEGTEQESVTVPENEFTAVIETVALLEEPRLIVIVDGLTESWKFASLVVLAGQSVARLKASTEPRPVTWSYPVPAE